MARGINKVILIGNLGADPDARMTQQGSAVTNLNIATDESYKDKNTGQMVPKTEWHRVVIFNRLAEIAKDYLKKGSKVYVEGRLQTRKWQDQSGQDRYTTEIVANEMRMLNGKADQNQGGQHQQAPEPQSAPQPATQQQHAQSSPERGSASHGVPTNYKQPYEPPGMAPVTDDFDDDIPF